MRIYITQMLFLSHHTILYYVTSLSYAHFIRFTLLSFSLLTKVNACDASKQKNHVRKNNKL